MRVAVVAHPVAGRRIDATRSWSPRHTAFDTLAPASHHTLCIRRTPLSVVVMAAGKVTAAVKLPSTGTLFEGPTAAPFTCRFALAVIGFNVPIGSPVSASIITTALVNTASTAIFCHLLYRADILR